jgi:hypothetical protein
MNRDVYYMGHRVRPLVITKSMQQTSEELGSHSYDQGTPRMIITVSTKFLLIQI